MRRGLRWGCGVLWALALGAGAGCAKDGWEACEDAGLVPDYDGDGHAVPLCGGHDCDDQDSRIYPGAPEVCDGVDQDCNEDTRDEYEDQDGDGYDICAGDCDDYDYHVHPNLDEGDPVGNAVDDDCDGWIDEGDGLTDDDGDGWSEADGDCNDGLGGEVAYPGAEEVPDGIDNDCDLDVDEPS